MRTLKTPEEIDEILTSDEEFVLFIHTEWSIPSVKLKADLENEEEACELPIYLIDADEHPDKVLQYDPRGTPMLLWIDSKETKKWQVGYLPGETLEHLFELGGESNDDSS